VWFQQAAGKLSRNTIEVFNPTNSLWESIAFKVQLPTSGRWIGRNKDFFSRRYMLSPEELPSAVRVIRFTSEPATEFLVYGIQQNIEADRSYLFEYTLLNIEPGYANIIELVAQPVASGTSGKKLEQSKGLFPIATDRYASANSTLAKDMVQSRVNLFLPTYAALKRQDVIRWAGLEYDVKEVFPELLLTRAEVVQR
jgi:hypothetical protein